MERSLCVNRLEELQLSLREIYKNSGYARYSIGKFEEYDLYAKNKDFLVSNRVITFTDTDGKLMALKPDVTLSIIKNSKGNAPLKVFYDENVFRISKDSLNFKEIKQTGLECLGEIDDFRIFEVTALALKSLEKISPDNVLNIADIDVALALLDYAGLVGNNKEVALSFIKAKNAHGILDFCEREGIDKEKGELLELLASIRGCVSKVEKNLKRLAVNQASLKAVEGLIKVATLLSERFGEDKVNIDFSIIGDTNYYNGITFNGFVAGVPSAVLSGGRYDKLLRRMNKTSGAIGFAIYLDLLDKIYSSLEDQSPYAVILYSDNSDIKTVFERAEELKKEGKVVSIEKDFADLGQNITVDLR